MFAMAEIEALKLAVHLEPHFTAQAGSGIGLVDFVYPGRFAVGGRG